MSITLCDVYSDKFYIAKITLLHSSLYKCLRKVTRVHRPIFGQPESTLHQREKQTHTKSTKHAKVKQGMYDYVQVCDVRYNI